MEPLTPPETTVGNEEIWNDHKDQDEIFIDDEMEIVSTIKPRGNAMATFHIETIWNSGEICAYIIVRSSDTYDKEITILDEGNRWLTIPLKPRVKHAFVFVNDVVHLSVAHAGQRSIIEAYIDKSDITACGGFKLSGVIALIQKRQNLQLFGDELKTFNQTMQLVCERYCQKLANPVHALSLYRNEFVRRQRASCGLYMRTLSPYQSIIYGKPKYFGRDSIFPLCGTLERSETQGEEILVTLCFDGEDAIVVPIQKDIKELNDRGCFFIAEGIVPAGKIEKLPDWHYWKVSTSPKGESS